MEGPINAAALREAMEALSGRHDALRARIRLRLDSMELDGGPGSGNWGHSGRPGMRGGSMPGGGKINRISLKNGEYASAAKQWTPMKIEKPLRAVKKPNVEKQPEPEKQPELSEYDRLRQDAKRKLESVKEADARVQAARQKIDRAKRLGSPELEDAEKELAEWDPKLKALRREYDDLLGDAGLATVTEEKLFKSGIERNAVTRLDTPHSEEEIIKTLAGGDETEGSCASLALAYAGQKQGLDVLDFRGGESLDFFSDRMNKQVMFDDIGADMIIADTAETSAANGRELLTQLTEGKQYYFSNGGHVAIVRVLGGKPQYLELQHPVRNGWEDFDDDVEETLVQRFGCTEEYGSAEAYAVDIDQLAGEDFEAILGYINTNGAEQRKGIYGSVR